MDSAVLVNSRPPQDTRHSMFKRYLSTPVAASLGLGLFFYFWYFSTGESSTLISLSGNGTTLTGSITSPPFHIRDLLPLLGSSFLVAGIFSIALGFTDLIEYVTKRLKDIIINYSYLESLSKEERQNLKSSLDNLLYGQELTECPGGLYQFIDNQLDSILNQHYREEYRDSYTYIPKGTSGLWELTNINSYDMCFAHLTKTDFSIDWGESHSKVGALTGDKLQDWVHEHTATIDSCTYRLNAEDSDTYYLTLDMELTKGIKESETDYIETENVILPKKVPVDVFNDAAQITCSYSIPVKLVVNDEQGRCSSISVKSYTVETRAMEDKVNSIIFSRPTKSATITCDIRDHEKTYNLSVSHFCLDDSQVEQWDGPNKVGAKIKGWAIAGHGVTINWGIDPGKG